MRFAGKIFFGFYGSAPPFQGKFLVLRSVKLLSSAVSQFFNDAVKNILPSPLSTRDLRETLWGEQNLLQLAHKKKQKIVTFSRKSIQAKKKCKKPDGFLRWEGPSCVSLFLFVEKQTLQFGGRQIKSCRADTDTPQAKPKPNVIKPSGFLLPLLLRAKIYTRAENNHHFFFAQTIIFLLLSSRKGRRFILP